MPPMNKLRKKYLIEYLNQHPAIKTGKKKQATREEQLERNNSMRRSRDKAKNRKEW